ncbi:hypothetical protein P4534_23370 [Peribacillus butanolivorans]|uniref:hypothetical protein n=1 Tax=Peribacillus butanolivorans TaxID=421767 RepID=UPI002E222DAF|nr:hypothetical protein [Peribacillus butanolivorans]
MPEESPTVVPEPSSNFQWATISAGFTVTLMLVVKGTLLGFSTPFGKVTVPFIGIDSVSGDGAA